MAYQPDDWRLANGGGYLNDLLLSWKAYTRYGDTWDHDHCELCMCKFVEAPKNDGDALTEGYSTPDKYRWVCKDCFDDFKDLYRWRTDA